MSPCWVRRRPSVCPIPVRCSSVFDARYYDATIGRFTQPDSIIPNIYNPQYLNRYSYVRNNPVRYTDPTGHRDECGEPELPTQTKTDSDPTEKPDLNDPPPDTGGAGRGGTTPGVVPGGRWCFWKFCLGNPSTASLRGEEYGYR
jgi:hypothetical protein